MQQLQNIIETAFERRAEITPANADTVTREAVNQVIALLDSGALRVAEKIDGQWVTHQWLKKAVLLSFRINDNQVIEGAESRYFDKVPMKFADYDEARFQKEGFRVVPPAAVRQGAFIARNTVLMPSYVNIGAYVDEGTMVDTWATVGSCAQIGKNVHLSGGVGIGGVLEPLQANPTIIEDNCFIGARSEVVEGVIVEVAAFCPFDKVPMKFADYDEARFQKEGFRVVPPAAVRQGAFIARNTVLMPSYVNIGAYVDEGTMVDTWATVGSCAQIGKNVHLSGGVGIGGVLEPLQANPTIIEDNCFIGARSEVVEGVIVEEGSVISMGVYIGQSTRIYDRETGEIHYGRVPAGSVVVSGNLPSKDGKYSLYCAVIVKKVDAKTRGKVGINELLRTID